MGIADLIPGVSGGTVAFITGIYDRLLTAISHVDKVAVQLLLKGKIKECWSYIDGGFLVSLLFGILTSVVAFSTLILWLKSNYPVPLWSFFFGLILCSSVLVLRAVQKLTLGNTVLLFVGVVLSYLLTTLSPMIGSTEPWVLFFSGMIAISAMILPGISGSFILLMLGEYTIVMQAVSDRNIMVIAIFGLGCVLGLLIFARILKFLLSKYHDDIVMFLIGVMLGALSKVWPWREVTSTYTDRHGEIKALTEANIWPSAMENPMIIPAVIAFVFAIALIVSIALIDKKKA